MCKPKSEGGQRCFAHAAGTKAALNYVHAKTGIDKKQIYAIMKELNKEGRKLENPTPEEIEKYFSLEEFKTKYDTSLTEKEKVTILKQLVSARAEAEAQRAVQRFKKPFIGLTLTGTLLFTASCSAGVIEPNNTKGPEETKTPVAATCTIENTGELGDVVALEEITDEHGTYCHVTVSPDAKDGYMTLADSPSGDLLKEGGWTEEDVIKAQDASYRIAIEETLDSSRLDNFNSTVQDWYKTSGNKNVLEFAQHYYTDALKEDPNNNLGLLVTDSVAGSLLRDGQARVEDVEIKTIDFKSVLFEGEKYLQVELSYSAKYRSSDETIIATIQKFNPNKTVEQIKAENPDLADSDPNSVMIISASQKLTYKKEDTTKIVGSSLNYSLFTGSSPSTITTVEG